MQFVGLAPADCFFTEIIRFSADFLSAELSVFVFIDQLLQKISGFIAAYALFV